jgi:hypothetical protein
MSSIQMRQKGIAGLVKRDLFTKAAGLPDFTWYNIPKGGKAYQSDQKYIKMAKNIPK